MLSTVSIPAQSIGGLVSMKILNFLAILFSASLMADTSYMCSNDDAYQKFINGFSQSLDGITKWSNKTNCLNNCRDLNSCVSKIADDSIPIASGKTSLTKSDSQKITASVAGLNFYSIRFISNQEVLDFVFDTHLSGSSFLFPPSANTSEPYQEHIVWSKDNNYIKTVSQLEDYNPTCPDGEVLQNNKCFKTITYAPTNSTCPLGGALVSGVCRKDVYSTPICKNEDIFFGSRCYAKASTPLFRVEARQGAKVLSMRSGTYLDPATGEETPTSFYATGYFRVSGYTCQALKGQSLPGDIGNNFFSSVNTCESACFIQKDCVPFDETKGNCVVTGTEYSHPVTDYTGKTVFTQATFNYKCTEVERVQTGCESYHVKNNYGSLSYDLSSIGWKYSTYSGMEEAATKVLMTEQMQHIFSGWAGYCESGKVWNNPFNDPLTILSYAFMAYEAAGSDLLKGTAVGDMHTSLQKNFNELAKTASERIDSFTESLGIGRIIEYAPGGGSSTSIGLSDKIKQWNTIKDYAVEGWGTFALKWSSVASFAMQIAFPPKEEFIQADKLMQTWIGGSDQDNASLSYASCMASIGLSFPNLVSWSASDTENASNELNFPWENPLRLTDQQVGILIAATSESYVKTLYIPMSSSGDINTFVALTGDAYFQAGQVICGGKLAVAQNLLNVSKNSPVSGGSNIGMAAAKLALSVLPPPYNFVGTLIFDIVTAFESGDACNDLDIAMKWGLIQFKTNQHQSFGQCHKTGSECVAKWFWGSCMRTRHSYCCYDQITTRIFMEGLKPQLGKNWSSCSDVSINELKSISFVKCKTGQDPYLDKCFPASSYNEFVDAMKTQASKGLVTTDMQGLIDQAVNSMAIPGRDLNDLCKDCKK